MSVQKVVCHPAVRRGIIAAAIVVGGLGLGVHPVGAMPMDHLSMPIKVETAAPAAGRIILAPFFEQIDGSIWGESDCGPTSLSMALGGIGINAKQLDLRALANQQMGSSDPDLGTSWPSLAYAATSVGAKVDGLTNGPNLRNWTIADLTSQLQQGRPVVLLVRRGDLTDLGGSSYGGDHYIVALGVAPDGSIVYNDPAMHGGAARQINPDQLLLAWSDTTSGQLRTAMAVYR